MEEERVYIRRVWFLYGLWGVGVWLMQNGVNKDSDCMRLEVLCVIEREKIELIEYKMIDKGIVCWRVKDE